MLLNYTLKTFPIFSGFRAIYYCVRKTRDFQFILSPQPGDMKAFRSLYPFILSTSFWISTLLSVELDWILYSWSFRSSKCFLTGCYILGNYRVSGTNVLCIIERMIIYKEPRRNRTRPHSTIYWSQGRKRMATCPKAGVTGHCSMIEKIFQKERTGWISFPYIPVQKRQMRAQMQ